MSAELRGEWVCSRCSVRVYIPGREITAPVGWNREVDACLACEKQGETPQESARRMVLEGFTVTKVSRACRGMSRDVVKELRAGLIESGELDPDKKPKGLTKPKPKPKKKRKPPRRRTNAVPVAEQIGPMLRADPDRSSREIAEEIGASVSRVRVVRKKLGYPPPKLDGRGRPVR